MKKLNAPLVLGEIIVGLILGPSLLGLLVLGTDPTSSLTDLFGVSKKEIISTADVILFLAELGAVFLLFEIGLQIDLRGLKKQGKESALVATGGVILPFLGGFLLLLFLDIFMPELVDNNDLIVTALFLGVTLTATSIGISMRVFMDLKQLDTKTARVLIGAAIIDDILALFLLTVAISYFEEKNSLNLAEVGQIALLTVGFFGVTLITAKYFLPKLVRLSETSKDRYLTLIVALSLLFVFSWLASMMKLAPIIGAFMAGLIINQHETFSDRVQEQIITTTHWVVPIFFIAVGLKVDLETLLSPVAILFTVLLFFVAILTKIVGSAIGSLLMRTKKKDAIVVGIGMAARGEVLLVFASTGFAIGVFTPLLYSSIIGMVVLCAIIIPLLLRYIMPTAEISQQ